MSMSMSTFESPVEEDMFADSDAAFTDAMIAEAEELNSDVDAWIDDMLTGYEDEDW